MKFNKEELDELINVKNKTYRDIGKQYGVSDAYIKKIAKKLGVQLPKRRNFPESYSPHNKGTIKKAICMNCENEFVIINQCKQKFCNKKCASEYKTKKYYDYYMSHQDEFQGIIRHMRFLKRYILIEQNNKCAICGHKNIWNNKPLNFILDHIDGNAANNIRNNLRLICSNCDSQLDTYKSKNKNSARKERYLRNYKN